MDKRLLSCAALVISQVDRENPADQVLRTVLKSARDLEAMETGQVARAVFAYYRWRGWLELRKPLAVQIEQASRLAERFATEPESFVDADLVARAVPPWVPREMEVSPAFVRALQAEPKLWLRARPGKGLELARQLGRCRVVGVGALGDALEYHGHVDLFQTTAFAEGQLEVQDLSSQAVGLICAPRPGTTWWDVCAGEGGKTVHLSDLMENRGLIWATDRSTWRLQRLKRRAARAKVFNYRAALWQSGPALPTKTKFDGILVDAPCSGVGTWQRNPHARWTTSLADVQELAALQAKLLARTAGSLKPGGILIYSVCTLTRSETIHVAEAVDTLGLNPMPIRNPLSPDSPTVARLFLKPQDFGSNGMFISAWQRA